jgi:hypothetical protein
MLLLGSLTLFLRRHGLLGVFTEEQTLCEQVDYHGIQCGVLLVEATYAMV